MRFFLYTSVRYLPTLIYKTTYLHNNFYCNPFNYKMAYQLRLVQRLCSRYSCLSTNSRFGKNVSLCKEITHSRNKNYKLQKMLSVTVGLLHSERLWNLITYIFVTMIKHLLILFNYYHIYLNSYIIIIYTYIIHYYTS